MDLGFAYKIMRARAPVGYPTVSSPDPSAPAQFARSPSGLQGDQAVPPDLQLQITSRPRRSLSAAALTWGPVQVEEQSVNTAGGPNASQGRTSQPRYPSPVAVGSSPHRGHPAAPASPDANVLPLHLVPRPLVPSARGVTIGPFAEAIAAASATRSPRRRPLATDSPTLHLLMTGSGVPSSPPLQPAPLPTSLSSPPLSPSLKSRSVNIHPPPPQRQHREGAAVATPTTSAAVAVKRARYVTVQQPLPQQPQQPQEQQQLLLPLVASHRGGVIVRQNTQQQQLQPQQQGAAASTSAPLNTPTTTTSIAAASGGCGSASLSPSASAPVLTMLRAASFGRDLSAPRVSSRATATATATTPLLISRTSFSGIASGGPRDNTGGASAPSLPTVGQAAQGRHHSSSFSTGAMAAVAGDTSGFGFGTEAAAVAPATDAGGAASEADFARHGEASHVAADDDVVDGGSAGHMALAGSGSSGGRESGVVMLPLLATGQAYMGYQGSGLLMARNRTQRQVSSVSASNGRSQSQGGGVGGGGGVLIHGSNRQQQALMLAQSSSRQLVGQDEGPGVCVEGLEGADMDADVAELDHLEEWVAAAGQLSSAVVEVAIEQRRALRRLAQLRSRLLKSRAGGSTDGGDSSATESGAAGPGGGSSWRFIPSWVSDVSVTGPRGSDSLVALASQVSRLPHIDYDQVRDPQYRMQLKARSKPIRPVVLNPVISDELEDMPIRGRSRPWKPLHI